MKNCFKLHGETNLHETYSSCYMGSMGTGTGGYPSRGHSIAWHLKHKDLETCFWCMVAYNSHYDQGW